MRAGRVLLASDYTGKAARVGLGQRWMDLCGKSGHAQGAVNGPENDDLPAAHCEDHRHATAAATIPLQNLLSLTPAIIEAPARPLGAPNHMRV
jgi:hypothetical protein